LFDSKAPASVTLSVAIYRLPLVFYAHT